MCRNRAFVKTEPGHVMRREVSQVRLRQGWGLTRERGGGEVAVTVDGAEDEEREVAVADDEEEEEEREAAEWSGWCNGCQLSSAVAERTPRL